MCVCVCVCVWVGGGGDVCVGVCVCVAVCVGVCVGGGGDVCVWVCAYTFLLGHPERLHQVVIPLFKPCLCYVCECPLKEQRQATGWNVCLL